MFPSQDPIGVKLVSDYPHQIVDDPTVWIPMSDGIRLAARIWRPALSDDQPVPVVIEMTPYRRRDGTLPVDERIHPYLAGHGVAAIRIDLRGSGDSEGILEDEYLPREHDDAIEIIEWAARQPWSNGCVGMTGLSWGGFNSLQVAARQPPSLKAIVAVSASVDRYNDDIHYKNGCLLNENFGWGVSLTAFTTRPPDPSVVGVNWRSMWLNRLENLKFFAENWFEHQTYDDYWKHGSVQETFDDIQVPVMIVSGWCDHLYVNAVPALLDNLKVPCRAICGPWAHQFPHMATPGPVVDYLGETLRWWKRWLVEDSDFSSEDKSCLAFVKQGSSPNPMAAEVPGVWTHETQWPSPSVVEKKLYLSANGLTADAVPAPARIIHSPLDIGATFGEWTPHSFGPEIAGDQRQIDAGSLVFDGEILQEQFDILGNPALTLTLSSDAPTGNLIIRLCDVGPEGQSELVSIGTLNLAQRDGNDQVVPMPLMQPVTLSIRLDHVSHRFPKGHRIRIALSTALWPLIWPAIDNPTLSLAPLPAQLTLPHRQSDDNTLTDGVDVAEIPMPSATRELRKPNNTRHITHDLVRGHSIFEIVDDFGKVEFLNHGMVSDAVKRERYEISGDDPLSATAWIHWTFEYQRDNWQVRTETEASMTCDSKYYHLSATISAYEQDEQVFERQFERTIKRLT